MSCGYFLTLLQFKILLLLVPVKSSIDFKILCLFSKDRKVVKLHSFFSPQLYYLAVSMNHQVTHIISSSFQGWFTYIFDYNVFLKYYETFSFCPLLSTHNNRLDKYTFLSVQIKHFCWLLKIGPITSLLFKNLYCCIAIRIFFTFTKLVRTWNIN